MSSHRNAGKSVACDTVRGFAQEEVCDRQFEGRPGFQQVVESRKSVIQVKRLESDTIITEEHALPRVVQTQHREAKDIRCNAKN